LETDQTTSPSVVHLLTYKLMVYSYDALNAKQSNVPVSRRVE